MKRKQTIRTKRPMLHVAFRLKREDRELWREAAMRTGESLNEFIRVALRERGRRVMLDGHLHGEQSRAIS